jgi:acyl-[acyl-carrier-protein]-phospholipid O-acyltransferase/long-chain-fatty-acid--[acyl-carrier-protein] ligase
VLLPPGEAGALVNVALALAGRASVNLNYSLGPSELADTVRRAGLAHVVTSRSFALDRELSAATLFVEELAGAGPVEHGTRDEVATVIFSSGTTRRPKGVVLTHANVLANVAGVCAAFGFGAEDRVLGCLPFFHSFGYTMTLWAPLLSGASAVYCPDARDARAVCAAVREQGVTITLATPALYQLWLRRATRADFAGVRAAVVGGQKLPPTLAARWREQIGGELLEGYGCTELSPVVAANVPGASRPGTVGRPLANVEVLVRDPDTGAVLPAGAEGALFVRGPSVMRGYLDQPAETAAVLRDGWYATGDVGRLDEEGFLVITDRRSRFTKIAGEMVPHARVEQALEAGLARLGHPDVALAVTTVPDEERGERLAVVHTPLGVPVEELIADLVRAGVPRVFVPRADAFVEVAELPRSGTGKVDLAALRRLALGER